MKKIILLICIALIALTSCKNKELEELKIENERLKNEMFQESQTVYAWTVIHCKQGTYIWSQHYERLEKVKEHSYWSEIELVYDYNEDAKYQLQDKLENQIRNKLGQNLHSILNRETFIFDSYAEASQFRNNVINGTNRNKR